MDSEHEPEPDPRAIACGAADQLADLLDKIASGEMTAPPGLVARIEAAVTTLRAVERAAR